MAWDDYNAHEKATILFGEGDFIKGIEYYGRRWLLYAYKFDLWEVVYNPDNNYIEKVQLLEKKRAKIYCHKVNIDYLLGK